MERMDCSYSPPRGSALTAQGRLLQVPSEAHEAKGQFLSHDGNGNTWQPQCLSHGGSGNTRRRGSALATAAAGTHGNGSGNTRQRQGLTAGLPDTSADPQASAMLPPANAVSPPAGAGLHAMREG